MSNQKNIYIVGSLNIDLVSNVKRLPKIGETVLSTDFCVNCGGKGANQAVAVSKLGGSAKMIGAVGNDTYGQLLLDNLKQNNVSGKDVKVAQTHSGIALINVVKGNNSIVVNSGANFSLTDTDVITSLKNAQPNDIIIAQLESPIDVITAAFKCGKEKGLTTILNPAPAVNQLGALAVYTDIIIPNETETQTLTGVNPNSEVEIALAAKSFYKMGIKNVIITLGSRGVAVCIGQHIDLIKARKVKVVDTTSAGDTFVGALAVKLAEGSNLLDAANFGNLAASITVTRKGASISIPDYSEVQEICKQ